MDVEPLYGNREVIPAHFPMPVIQTSHVLHFSNGEAAESEAPEWQYFIEESAELIKEICKYSRGKGNHDHIAEEIGDVYLTLANIQEIFGVDVNMVQANINAKIRRHGLEPDAEQLSREKGAV